MKNTDIPDKLVVGIVGHVSIDDIKELKDTIENISFFNLIFFKTSSEKLWIKEGER